MIANNVDSMIWGFLLFFWLGAIWLVGLVQCLILKDWMFLLGKAFLIWLSDVSLKNNFWLFSLRAEKASNDE